MATEKKPAAKKTAQVEAPGHVTPKKTKPVTKVAKEVSTKKTTATDKTVVKSASGKTDVKPQPAAKTIISSLSGWPFPTGTKP